MQEIRIGDRVIPILLSCMELPAIQDEIGCTVAQLRDEVFGIYEDDEPAANGKPKWNFSVVTDPQKLKKMGTLIKILGNAGLEEKGETPDLTEKWILRNLPPPMILPMAVVLIAIINDAMMMETEKKEETETSGPVDVTIEEERRKKAQRK